MYDGAGLTAGTLPIDLLNVEKEATVFSRAEQDLRWPQAEEELRS